MISALILSVAITGQCGIAGCAAPAATYYRAVPTVTYYQAPAAVYATQTTYTATAYTVQAPAASPGPVRRVIGRILHPFRG